MKKVKILTITLAIILIAMVAFGGVYIKYQNRMVNKVKDYSYTMDLEGARTIKLKLSTDVSETIVKDADGNVVENSSSLTDEQITENGYTKEEKLANSDEVKTVENYKKSKEIIEERLKKLGVDNYIARLDEQTGEMVIELPENSDTDNVISCIYTPGKFEIVDNETQEVLMTNDDIEKVNVLYGQSSTASGTIVNLDVKFNKEGTKKFENITKTYVKSENTENATSEENTESEENAEATTDETSETTEKQIALKIDGTSMMTTSFSEVVETGELQLTIGSATTDNDTFKDNLSQASNISIILNTGNMPIVYELDKNEYLLSDITQDMVQMAELAILAIALIGLVILIIRYKYLGFLGAISYVGLVSIFTLIIRYTNVSLSIEGILGFAISLALNYIFVNSLLAKLKNRVLEIQDVKNAYNEVNKKFFKKIVPIIIMIIIFAFMSWAPISSFGMVMFWGIVLIAIYNVIVTNNVLKIKAIKN